MTAAGLVAFPSVAQAAEDPHLSVTCSPNRVEANKSTTCTARTRSLSLTRPAATGTVKFVASPGRGSFVLRSTCTLTFRLVGGFSACSVTYLPNGNVDITRLDFIAATYSGNDIYAGDDAVTHVVVTPKGTDPQLGLHCAPTTVKAGATTTCTVQSYATFLDSPFLAPTPTKPVTFGSTGKGSFTPTSCTMGFPNIHLGAFPECSVAYRPTGAAVTGRKDSITATYPGDETYYKDTESVTVSVIPGPS